MAVVIGQDLLHEKSLWQIYRQCVRVLPPSKFNIASSAVFLFALICDVAYFPSNYQYRIESARSMADIGLGFGSTVLGFLIAGFTIFSTLTRPDLFRRLYEKTHTPSGLSYLKVNFFTFAEVFVVYAFLLIICLCVKIFCGPSGIIASVVKISELNPVNAYYLDRIWLVNSAWVLFSVLQLYSLLALKSFIFNTYHTVMTSIVWSFNAPTKG
jgi:hypothetical protein